MTAPDPLRDELSRAAQPPTSTEGVADAVLDRIASAPPGGGGGAAAGAGVGTWAVVTGVAAVFALVVGVGLGLRADDDDPQVVAGAVAAGTADAEAVVLLDCPDGEPVGTLGPGDRVLVVARADDAWVAVRSPSDLGAQAWVRAEQVVPDGDLAGVPEGSCDPGGELALVLPGGETVVSVLDPPADEQPDAVDQSGGPAPGAAVPGAPAPGPNPTSTTRPGASTTSTTAAPSDTTGPVIGNAFANPGKIWETSPGLCAGKPKSATIAAHVTDPSGVASVTASWTLPGKPTTTRAMTGGADRSTTFGPYNYPTVPENPTPTTVTVTITATDTVGNTRTATVQVQLTSAADCFG